MALPNRIHSMNTVPNPSVEREERRRRQEEQEKLKHSRELYRMKTAAQNNKVRKRVVGTILLMATLVLATLWRSAAIYTLQNEYVTIQGSIRETHRQNEDLRGKIIKASAIGEVAMQSLDLDLIVVDQGMAIHTDLSKNHFEELEVQVQKESLTDKILSIIPFEVAH